jgi:hypothetical protein
MRNCAQVVEHVWRFAQRRYCLSTRKTMSAGSQMKLNVTGAVDANKCVPLVHLKLTEKLRENNLNLCECPGGVWLPDRRLFSWNPPTIAGEWIKDSVKFWVLSHSNKKVREDLVDIGDGKSQVGESYWVSYGSYLGSRLAFRRLPSVVNYIFGNKRWWGKKT